MQINNTKNKKLITKKLVPSKNNVFYQDFDNVDHFEEQIIPKLEITPRNNSPRNITRLNRNIFDKKKKNTENVKSKK